MGKGRYLGAGLGLGRVESLLPSLGRLLGRGGLLSPSLGGFSRVGGGLSRVGCGVEAETGCMSGLAIGVGGG